MQDVWQEVCSNKSIYSRLWSFGFKSLRSRECGMYEAIDLLLGDHLYEKSDTVKWIDAAQPRNRKKRVKKHSELVAECEGNPYNTNIFEDNLIDNFYPERPLILENVCLYDFVKLYTCTGSEDDGKRKYSKLNKPNIPNHKLDDPNKDGQSVNYYYSLLLLFVPFHSEDELICDGETSDESFNRHLLQNSQINAYHDKLQQILLLQCKMKEIKRGSRSQKGRTRRKIRKDQARYWSETEC